MLELSLPHLGEGGVQGMGEFMPLGGWAVPLCPSTHITSLGHGASKGSRTIREGLLVLTPIVLTCLSA